MADIIKLNKNYSLVKVDELTYQTIELCKDKDKEIFINNSVGLIKRSALLKGLTKPLNKFVLKHQLFCKTLLGEGEPHQMRTPSGNQFEEIPLNWIWYPNYKTGGVLQGLMNEREAQNGLSPTKHTIPVVSFNTALAALEITTRDYAVVILNKQ